MMTKTAVSETYKPNIKFFAKFLTRARLEVLVQKRKCYAQCVSWIQLHVYTSHATLLTQVNCVFPKGNLKKLNQLHYCTKSCNPNCTTELRISQGKHQKINPFAQLHQVCNPNCTTDLRISQGKHQKVVVQKAHPV